MAALLDWHMGFRNGAGKYLTAESFMNKLSVGATAMKKKQIWELLQKEGEDFCQIKAFSGNCLYVNVDGDLKVDGNQTGDDETYFIIEAQEDGRWAMKSKKYGWYFSSPDKERCAFVSDLAEEHKWVVHLAMHPQVCLHNVNRKRYMHLSDDKKSLSCDELIPWGDDATITLAFFSENGTYGLQTCTGSYLEYGGRLSDEANADCQFVLVFKDSLISFKSKSNGKYLTALGPNGTCKANKASINKDEQFHIEDSHPQIKLTASNGLKVSIHGGVEIQANRNETTDEEIFQVEPDQSGKWTFKCRPEQSGTCKFWELKDNALSATAENTDGDDTHFEVEWINNKIALKASNGKYLAQLNNKCIHAKAEVANDDEKSLFTWEIVNRPRLVLRGEYGFVGTLPSGLLECNKSVPETYVMHITAGFCKIAHPNGKYWNVKSDGSKIVCDGDQAQQFTMELHKDSKMCLIHEGKYLACSQNGDLTMTGSGPSQATLFEY